MDKSQGGIPNRRYKWDFPPNSIFSPSSWSNPSVSQVCTLQSTVKLIVEQIGSPDGSGLRRGVPGVR